MIIEYTPTIEKTAQDVIRTAINTAKKLNSPVRFTIAGQRYEVTPNVNADLAIQEFKADRKSTRLNSSHVAISYAVFCLKKKKMHYDILNVCFDSTPNRFRFPVGS